MAKPEWGVKRTCPQCATRFYDLMRDPLTCPACGTTFDPTAVARPKRGKAAATAKRAVVADPVEQQTEDQLATGDAAESDEDDVLDLGDDDVEEDLPEASSESEDEESSGFTEPKILPGEEDAESLEDDSGETLDNDDDEVSLSELEEPDDDEDEDDPDRR